MKKVALLLALALFAACSSSAPAGAGGAGRHDDPGGVGNAGALMSVPGGLELFPPLDWWHDEQLAPPVGLDAKQLAALDAIGDAQAPAVEKLQRDAAAAIRDLRLIVDASQVTANDIVASGERLRGVREDLVMHEVKMLADERLILTQQQWTTLQNQLHERRSDQRNNRPSGSPRGGGRRGGGRGGWGGGGFPGGQ